MATTSQSHINYSPVIIPPTTEFFIDQDVFGPEFAHECQKMRRKIALFADVAIAETWGEKLCRHLEADLFVVPGGESCKTRAWKQKLEDLLIEKKFGRDSLFLAMGGGCVTDLIGYLASTYLRGVPLILIPTTLLGMVDSAIGGKNAVNTPRGKNLIGTLYHPKAVIMDLQFLQTLPQKEWYNGLSEILKHGLIRDPRLWQLCEEQALGQWQNPSFLLNTIHASITLKLEVAEADLAETGMRRILNYGHTIAHGLEVLSKYKMSHGEAVAIGCMTECWLSHHAGHLSRTDLERILQLYRRYGYKVRLPKNFAADTFAEALTRDKKAARGQARYVMIDRIGNTLPFDGSYCTGIEESDYTELIRWMKANAQ
ncbi:MAG: 3-dehydroquinate synthase [Chlamydiia bacterium]|nr:3-dehydroquinate synthase [Chlamydiia bacterium]